MTCRINNATILIDVLGAVGVFALVLGISHPVPIVVRASRAVHMNPGWGVLALIARGWVAVPIRILDTGLVRLQFEARLRSSTKRPAKSDHLGMERMAHAIVQTLLHLLVQPRDLAGAEGFAVPWVAGLAGANAAVAFGSQLRAV
jgi:hypothetical protein